MRLAFAFSPAVAVRRAGLALSIVVSAAACSSSGHPPGPDADASRDAADAADDGGTTGLTCQAIRLCVAAGSSAETCAARGTPEAMAAFQALLDCLAPHCPDQVPACVCREACQQPDGFCLDLTDSCLAASGNPADAVCGQYCGG